MKKATLTFFATLLIAPVANGETFAMIDGDGTRTFTDKPVAAKGAALPAAPVRIGHEVRHSPESVDSADLAGTWRALSHNGDHTRFELRENGTFVFDSRSATTPERTYMCGRLDIDGDTVSMALSAVKRRDSDGVIEQLLGKSTTEAQLVSTSRHRMVLRLDGRTMVFVRVVG